MVTEIRDKSARTEQSHTMVHNPLISTSEHSPGCQPAVTRSQASPGDTRLLRRISFALCCLFTAGMIPNHSLFGQSPKSAQTVSFNIRTLAEPPAVPPIVPTPQLADGGEVSAALPLNLEPVNLEPATPPQVSGHVVACQAANCWPLAKLLDQRARTLLCEAEERHRKSQGSANLQANFLRHQAAWQRDVAAALALRAYYSWIANQQQLQLVEEGLALQREQVQVQEALIAKGIAIADPTALQRKRLELEDNKIQLLSNDRQLKSGLLRLTCCHTDLSQCATESLDIQVQACDCNGLLSFALQHRHDYLAVVQLCQCLDEEIAVAVAQLLSPLVGVGIDILDLNLLERICLKHRGEELLGQIRRELKLASDVLRGRIEQSVCDKCQSLDAAYQRVTIAEEVIRSWETRVAALKRLEELGDARGEAMATARAELISARSTLVTRKLSAKLAEVDLAEAVGELSIRCCQGEAWLVR